MVEAHGHTQSSPNVPKKVQLVEAKAGNGGIPIRWKSTALKANSVSRTEFVFSKAAKHFGKRPNDFFALPSTVKYLAAVNGVSNAGKSGNWIVTKAAKHFGKDLSHFMRSPDTLMYVDALKSAKNAEYELALS